MMILLANSDYRCEKRGCPQLPDDSLSNYKQGQLRPVLVAKSSKAISTRLLRIAALLSTKARYTLVARTANRKPYGTIRRPRRHFARP